MHSFYMQLLFFKCNMSYRLVLITLQVINFANLTVNLSELSLNVIIHQLLEFLLFLKHRFLWLKLFWFLLKGFIVFSERPLACLFIAKPTLLTVIFWARSFWRLIFGLILSFIICKSVLCLCYSCTSFCFNSTVFLPP